MYVALRKESVDRNCGRSSHGLKTWAVALRKESVDRNLGLKSRPHAGQKSLSARRAWIEITSWRRSTGWTMTSLSARRAWIEISAVCAGLPKTWVALRKESVDRNTTALAARLMFNVALRKESVDRNGVVGAYPPNGSGSLSARRAWIEIGLAACCRAGGLCRSPQGERG